MKKYSVGIDLGSRMSKIVILDSKSIIYSNVMDTGVNPKNTAKQLFETALSKLKIFESEITNIFSTGYGRNIVPFADKRITEISCHAKGVNFLFPDARTVIDIGGQDSKAILLDSNGKVYDFMMNDRCAAGTGRFLEVVANILELTVNEMSRISACGNNELEINSTCVVFAESEIVGLISQGKKPAEIIYAVHRSVAKRILNLISQLHWNEPVVFTGGVAKNNGMKKAISSALKTEIIIPENPLITGALGAAIFAAEDCKKKNK